MCKHELSSADFSLLLFFNWRHFLKRSIRGSCSLNGSMLIRKVQCWSGRFNEELSLLSIIIILLTTTTQKLTRPYTFWTHSRRDGAFQVFNLLIHPYVYLRVVRNIPLLINVICLLSPCWRKKHMLGLIYKTSTMIGRRTKTNWLS